MPGRKSIQEIPGVLAKVLENVQAEYVRELRQVRWNDGPVYVSTSGDCVALAEAARYAFEALPGWPVVAHSAEVLQSYGAGLLAPRSTVLLISNQTEWPEGQEVARMVREHGGKVMALVNAAEDAPANQADHVFRVSAAGAPGSPALTVCTHAALNVLAFEAMRMLKKPRPWWEPLAKDFEELPKKLDWIFTQLGPLVRSVADQVARSSRLAVVGAGFFHGPAIHAARRLQQASALIVAAVEVPDFLYSPGAWTRGGQSVLLLSSSQSKLKKLVQRAAGQARAHGARVFSLTDGNDRELAEASDLTIVLPALPEAPASTLLLFMVEWLILELRNSLSAAPTR